MADEKETARLARFNVEDERHSIHGCKFTVEEWRAHSCEECDRANNEMKRLRHIIRIERDATNRAYVLLGRIEAIAKKIHEQPRADIAGE